MIPFAISAAALWIGVLMPLRWGTIGFVAVAAFLFALQAGLHASAGFEGTSITESLALFNGSWQAYLGFNLQITYRSFALPLAALAVPLIYRLSRPKA